MEKRVEYDELKRWVLEGLYDDQRNSLCSNGRTFSKIISLHSIADSYDGVFERPIENLMLAVFLSVLGSDCKNEMIRHWHDQIERIVAEQDLTVLLAGIGEDERFSLVVDLKALNLMPTVRSL